MDRKGRWHLLAHRWDYRDGWPVNPSQTMPVLVSGHGFSLDGLDWRFNSAEQPYNPWITFENGTRQHFSTYERPHLVFNDVGEPTHLVNGVSPYWDPPGVGHAPFLFLCLSHFIAVQLCVHFLGSLLALRLGLPTLLVTRCVVL
jgi:hypothetical protein